MLSLLIYMAAVVLDLKLEVSVQLVSRRAFQPAEGEKKVFIMSASSYSCNERDCTQCSH